MRTTTTYQWPKRPRLLNHPILGRRQRWTDRSGQFRIDRFPDDGDPRYIALVIYEAGWRVIGRNRTLRAAQRACRWHVRDRQLAASYEAAPAKRLVSQRKTALTQATLF